MAWSHLHLASWPHDLASRASKFGDIELHLEARKAQGTYPTRHPDAKYKEHGAK